jgi:hypothetical protein
VKQLGPWEVSVPLEWRPTRATPQVFSRDLGAKR